MSPYDRGTAYSGKDPTTKSQYDRSSIYVDVLDSQIEDMLAI